MKPVSGLMWMSFDDEYDYNERTAPGQPEGVNRSEGPARNFDGHEILVGDLCFVALGQIVNRSFNAVRYQPTGGLIVSSPTKSKVLRDAVLKEWSGLTSDQHRKKLIDDLLAFARMSRKELEHSEVDMTVLVQSTAAELCSLEPNRKVSINIQQLPKAKGDLAMLRQVFANLLSNALKFTRPSAHPAIEVGSYAKDEENIYYVKDNGEGFDMRYVEKLFGIFQRLHSREEFEGTGVGLAIVRRIVHRHEGRTWAEGKPHEGAKFYFSLPKGGNHG